jgi:hypothetical protein
MRISNLNSTDPVRLQVIAGPRNQKDEGLADAAAASPFRLPRLHPGIGLSGSLLHEARAGPGPTSSLQLLSTSVFAFFSQKGMSIPRSIVVAVAI